MDRTFRPRRAMDSCPGPDRRRVRTTDPGAAPGRDRAPRGASPTAQARGLPPKVLPCDPGVITSITSRSASTADTGSIPRPAPGGQARRGGGHPVVHHHGRRGRNTAGDRELRRAQLPGSHEPGQIAALLHLRCRDTSELESTLETIRSDPRADRTKSSVVLTTLVDRIQQRGSS